MTKKIATVERQITGQLGTLVPGVKYQVTAKSEGLLKKYEAMGRATIGPEGKAAKAAAKK